VQDDGPMDCKLLLYRKIVVRLTLCAYIMVVFIACRKTFF